MDDWKDELRTWRRETRRIMRMTPKDLRPLVAEQLRAHTPRTPTPSLHPMIWVPTQEEMRTRISVWSTGYTPVTEGTYFAQFQPYQFRPADPGALVLNFALEPT